MSGLSSSNNNLACSSSTFAEVVVVVLNKFTSFYMPNLKEVKLLYIPPMRENHHTDSRGSSNPILNKNYENQKKFEKLGLEI